MFINLCQYNFLSYFLQFASNYKWDLSWLGVMTLLLGCHKLHVIQLCADWRWHCYPYVLTRKLYNCITNIGTYIFTFLIFFFVLIVLYFFVVNSVVVLSWTDHQANCVLLIMLLAINLKMLWFLLRNGTSSTYNNKLQYLMRKLHQLLLVFMCVLFTVQLESRALVRFCEGRKHKKPGEKPSEQSENK